MFEGKHVAVLCGGDGKERDVSLKSGKAVYDALIESGYEAEILDLQSLADVDKVQDFEGAFIAMHGDWGEGGQLQEKLKQLQIPFTGSGAEASFKAMHKWNSKILFEQAHIRTPYGILWPEKFEDIVSKLGKNVVVKPTTGGSTVGVTIIKGLTTEKLEDAVKFAKESYDSDVMIEKYIEGREMTVAVWENNGKVEALPVIEIAPHEGFYDYNNKYTKGATDYIVPAKIETSEAEAMKKFAVKAHKILGCSSYSRSDFRLARNGKAFILEVNTAPGMTATSLVPKAANAVGISMADFVKSIMEMASCDKV